MKKLNFDYKGIVPPKAKEACERKEADTITITQGAFSKTLDEIVLLGSFIKYAGDCNKEVIILPHKWQREKKMKPKFKIVKGIEVTKDSKPLRINRQIKMEDQCCYGDVKAVKPCAICGAGLCSSCGYTIKDKSFCNECYMEYIDKNV